MATFSESDVEQMYSADQGSSPSLSATYGFALKAEQKREIAHLLNGENVFSVLPTGFGKTTCYSLLPTLFSCK